jgi:Protein of unknown function DUF115/Methyltransferase domain
MLTVCTVNAGNYCGRGADYVNRLFDGVRRNLQAGFKGRFVCFTDDPTGLDEGIETRPLPGGLEGYWNKLYLFSPAAFQQGERVLYLDLDTCITGPLDHIAAYNGDFAILRDVYRPAGLQSSVMLWEAGRYNFWEMWEALKRPLDPLGDQGILEIAFDHYPERYGQAQILQDLFPGKFRSYKQQCRVEIPRNTSVVFFHGKPRPHEIESGWVPEVWKVGGGSGTEWVTVSNTDDATLLANVKHAIGRKCQWLKPGAETDTAVIVGGGPSLTANLFYIRGMQMAGAKVYAVGNAYQYLHSHGLRPDAHVLCDARAENIDFVPAGSVPKYYASQCHPAVLQAAGDALVCWHAALQPYEGLIQDHEGLKLGGGTTVGLKAIALAFARGHRHLRLFGFDSSYGPSHHAYDQPLNDGERSMDVTVGGRTFKCAPWMISQAEDFKELMPRLMEAGCVVRVFGEGLIPWIASKLEQPGADQRAQQLHEWLKHVPNPKGAEIGVFTGALSRLLLMRPDLSLTMVDHWQTSGADSDYAQSGDFHATLTQKQQDAYFEATLEVTRFAGDRAQMIRASSVEAAQRVPDGSLDFVFIDADHSYAGCKADIQAWLPKLKPNGFISGHDYDHPEYPDFGVKRAVDEIFGVPETGANYTWRVRLAETWRLAL